MVCEMFAGRFQGGGVSKLCNRGGSGSRVEYINKFGGGGGFSSKVSFCQVGGGETIFISPKLRC